MSPRPYQRENLSWEGSLTFDDWVIKMVLEKRTDEAAFQSALTLWGRAKIEAIWKRYLERRAMMTHGEDGGA